MRSSSGGPSARRRIPRRPPAQSRTKSVPSARGRPLPPRRHRGSTSPRRIVDVARVRDFLESDPVGNAVTWDRVFQQANYEVFAEGEPPRGVLALQRPRRPSAPGFIALHAMDVGAAGSLSSVLPQGFTIIHLTEEFSLPLLEARATKFHPKPAWLFRLDPDDAVEVPDKEVRPLDPKWAGLVAALWEPEWPAEGYVRRRIE